MSRSIALFALAALVLMLAACGTKIGDPCESNFQCGTDNICDLLDSTGEGYCTRTPCRNRGCDDDEAVCVLFTNGESYCMHRCDNGGDCRDGHACRSAAGTCDGTAHCVADGSGPDGYCY